MLIGVTGVIQPVLRAVSPITVAANIAVLVSGEPPAAAVGGGGAGDGTTAFADTARANDSVCMCACACACAARAPCAAADASAPASSAASASGCWRAPRAARTTQGLALYNVGFPGVAACPQLGIMQMVTVILFSQYMRGWGIRLPGMKTKCVVAAGG
jgi:hypothetical protein